MQHGRTALRARLRGSPRPADCQNRRMKLSIPRGAFQRPDNDNNGPDLMGCRGMGTEIGAVLCLGDESGSDCIAGHASTVLIFG